jgi:cytochrome b561
VKEIHEIAANALVIVATFHAAAALIHHFVFHDDTLIRMLPRGKG